MKKIIFIGGILAVLVLGLYVLLFFGEDWIVEHDLRRICELSEKYQPLMGTNEKVTLIEYYTEIDEEIFHPEIKAALAKIKDAPFGEKIKVFNKLIRDLEYQNWNCPAFEDLNDDI